jgi:Domain of unknown function (DUF4145)
VTVENRQAHCPECDGERTCDVHGTIEKLWDFHDRQGHSMNGGVQHSLLDCRGCRKVFYETVSWDSESINHWYDAMGETQGEYDKTFVTYPKPESTTKPVWLAAIFKVDEQLRNILGEMYVAYDNQSYILTAVGLRTALDRATEVLGIDAAISFDEKLDELKSGGWIGDTEREILGVVTDAGNAAAHRGWSPDENEISELLLAMELFLQKAFIVGKKALSIKASIPSKPARKKRVSATILPSQQIP